MADEKEKHSESEKPEEKQSIPEPELEETKEKLLEQPEEEGKAEAAAEPEGETPTDSSEPEEETVDAAASSEPEEKIILGKADPVKRIIAFVIDAVAATIVGVVPIIGAIIGALYMLLRDALPVEALQNRSLGKKLLGLKVVMADNPSQVPDYAASAKRNWMFALGPIMILFAFIPILGWIVDILLFLFLIVFCIIEIVKLFTDDKGIRIGDKMAETMVIEEK